MNFIKLTCSRSHRPIWININKIESIECKHENEDNQYRSTIVTDSKDTFEVLETSDEIFKSMNKAVSNGLIGKNVKNQFGETIGHVQSVT